MVEDEVQVGYIDVQGGYIGVQGGYMEKKISSFKGYLSHSSSRVEFELRLGLRLTKNSLLTSIFSYKYPFFMYAQGDLLSF